MPIQIPVLELPDNETNPREIKLSVKDLNSQAILNPMPAFVETWDVEKVDKSSSKVNIGVNLKNYTPVGEYGIFVTFEYNNAQNIKERICGFGLNVTEPINITVSLQS